MSIHRLLPLPESEELDTIVPDPEFGLTSTENTKSLLFIGEQTTCKSCLLYQAGLSFVQGLEWVALIRPDSFDRWPVPVKNMVQREEQDVYRHMRLVYLKTIQDFIEVISTIHLNPNPPSAIIIDDLHFYALQVEEDWGLESAFVRLLTLLWDTIKFIAKQYGKTCEFYVSVLSSPKVNPLIPTLKRYFNEVWYSAVEHSFDHRKVVKRGIKVFTLTCDERPDFSAVYYKNSCYIVVAEVRERDPEKDPPSEDEIDSEAELEPEKKEPESERKESEEEEEESEEED